MGVYEHHHTCKWYLNLQVMDTVYSEGAACVWMGKKKNPLELCIPVTWYDSFLHHWSVEGVLSLVSVQQSSLLSTCPKTHFQLSTNAPMLRADRRADLPASSSLWFSFSRTLTAAHTAAEDGVIASLVCLPATVLLTYFIIQEDRISPLSVGITKCAIMVYF